MTNALDLNAPVDTLAMEFTREFDAPKPVELTVNIDSGAVDVTLEQTDKVTVTVAPGADTSGMCTVTRYGAVVSAGCALPSTDTTTSTTPVLSLATTSTGTSAPGSADAGATIATCGGSRSSAAPPAGATTIATSSEPLNCPSLADNAITWRPGAANVAVVSGADIVENVTAPGPDTFVQRICSDEPCGLPSSVTVPCSASGTPTTAVESPPASTAGGMFGAAAAVTTTLTSANDDSAPSVAVKRSA